MAGIYPNNQTIELFGEHVLWPGMGPDGKFTNGSFENPEQKPSFVPAQTINLILDNLSALIEKAGGNPNAVDGAQLADLISSLAGSNKIVQRDAEGRAKVSAPVEADDIARLAEITAASKDVMNNLSATARISRFMPPRDLKTVLGVTTIPAAMTALRKRCNGTGTPDFTGLQIGDYLDGISLSEIPAENGGDAGQVWNDIYHNNRIVLSAFNPYKGVGDTEIMQNHVRFDFANVPLKKRMNATNDNTGGYAATEIRAFLDGVNGDGTGGKSGVTTAAFLKALKAQIGDYILPVRRLLSTKNNSWAWITCSLWLPSEDEVFGESAFGESTYGDGQKLHIPLYRDSYQYRIKRYNGSRT
jgi:hypothetical protein